MTGKILRRLVGSSLLISSFVISAIMIQGMGNEAQPTPEVTSDTEELLVYSEPTSAPDTQVEPTPEPTIEPLPEEIVPEKSSCSAEQCLFQDICITKPSHASCLIQDSNNARVCDEGYIEVGSSCLSPTQYAEQQAHQQQKQATADAQQQAEQQAAATNTQQQFKATSDAQANAALLAKQQAAAEQKKQVAAQAKAAADAQTKATLLAQQQADAKAAADAQAKAALLAQQQTAAAQPTKRRTRAS